MGERCSDAGLLLEDSGGAMVSFHCGVCTRDDGIGAGSCGLEVSLLGVFLSGVPVSENSLPGSSPSGLSLCRVLSSRVTASP